MGTTLEAVLCTGNPHKLRELEVLLPGVRLRPLAPGDELAPETGTSFLQNARIKAVGGAALYPGSWTIADDSGLAVDALEGAPGVLSARFAGDDASDDDNTRLLLERLAHVPAAELRSARFVCVLVAVSPEGHEFAAEGEVRGTIAPEPAGDVGFGYDPVFVPEGETRTFAELGSEVKHRLSHRARATHRLLETLRREGALA